MTPVVAPIVASEGAALLHVPPGVASATDVVVPEHTSNVPVMGRGNELTLVVTEAGNKPVHPFAAI